MTDFQNDNQSGLGRYNEEEADIRSWRGEVEFYLKAETKKIVDDNRRKRGLTTRKKAVVEMVVDWRQIEKMLPPKFYEVMDPAAVAKEMVAQRKW